MSEDNREWLPIDRRECDQLIEAINSKDWSTVEEILTTNKFAKDQMKSKLLEQNRSTEENLLMEALSLNAPLSIIKPMIDIGGKEIFDQTDKNAKNVVHFACQHSSSLNVIECIVGESMNEQILSTDNDGKNAFHYICTNPSSTIKIIDYIFDTMEELDEAKELVIVVRNDKKDMLVNDIISKIEYLNLKEVLKDNHQKAIHILSLIGKICNEDDLMGLDQSRKDLLELSKEDDSKLDSLLRLAIMKRVINTEFVQQSAIPILMTDLYAQTALVVVFQCFIESRTVTQSNVQLINGLTIPALVWLVLREVLQLKKNPIRFLLDFFNWVDMAQIILVSLTLSNINHDLLLASSSETVAALMATIAVWIKLLLTIGNIIFPLAIFNIVLVQIMQKLVPFLITTIIVISAFANAFFLAGPKEHGDVKCSIIDGDDKMDFSQEQYDEGAWTCTRYTSFISALRMFFDGNWLFLATYPYSIQSILAMTYSFVIGVMLLNIIIAVISDAFEEGNSEHTSWLNRYYLITENDLVDVANWFNPFKRISQAALPRHSIISSIHSSEVVHVTTNKTNQYCNKLFKNEKFEPNEMWMIPLMIIPMVIIFIAGLLSFGTLWPDDMKEMLFFGPTEISENVKKENDKKLTNKELRADMKQIIIHESNNLNAKVNKIIAESKDLNDKIDEIIAENKKLKTQNDEMKKIIMALADKMDIGSM